MRISEKFRNQYGFAPGELIVAGFQGPILKEESKNHFQDFGNTQFILFTHNYQSPEQLIQLTDDIQNLSNGQGKMLITTDQEGGRVQRFRAPFHVLPSAEKLGKMDFETRNHWIKLQAKELFLAGIQLNFAPVCDLNTNPKNPVIGDRSFSVDIETASACIEHAIRVHHENHVMTCLKHFPGHGDTHLDSHYALPTVTTSLDTLRSREWIPFQRGVQAGCPMVMSAHILLPEVDAEFPGTLSKVFLGQYLRQELGFQGVIISDDMEMHAITKHYGREEAPILALQAGCDLLCYRSEEETVFAMESIIRAVENKILSPERIISSVKRTRNMRSQITLASDTLSKEQRRSGIGA